MSWVNPVSPIDAKNSIGFSVQFFSGLPGLVGDSVKDNLGVSSMFSKLWICSVNSQNSIKQIRHQLVASFVIALLASLLCPRNLKTVPQKRKQKVT